MNKIFTQDVNEMFDKVQEWENAGIEFQSYIEPECLKTGFTTDSERIVIPIRILNSRIVDYKVAPVEGNYTGKTKMFVDRMIKALEVVAESMKARDKLRRK